MSSLIKNWILVIVISLLSGWSDSRGFLYASNIWKNGKLVSDQLIKSALGFAGGIVTFWIVIRFLKELGVNSTEIQTMLWFSLVIIGVALSSGTFFHWNLREQIIAIFVIISMGWLLTHTSG